MKEIISDYIQAPSRDWEQHLVTDGQWSLFELIDFLCDFLPPSDLYISSYGISDEAIRCLHRLREENKLLEIHAFFDQSLRKTKTHLLYFAQSVLTGVKVCPNHSKLIIFLNNELDLVVNASANLSRNRRVETIFISTFKKTVDYYHKQFMHVYLENSIEL